MSWDWSPGDLLMLERFLADLELCHGPLRTRRIGDGHSNLTFLVGDGRRLVIVRRPPPPPTPPGAHDVLREATLLSALRGTAVPVPGVLGIAQPGEVIDVPLVVMSHVAGPVVTTRTPDPLRNADDRRAIANSLVDALAALHAVDWRARGLDGFGRPEGFNERHLRRMAGLVADDGGRPPAGFEEIDAWLAANVPPESGASIVHNDFRLGNMILAPNSPGRVAAILDWELATIGDPLLDVGYVLASYPIEGEELTPTTAMGTALLEQGYPTREEIAQRYVDVTGRDLGNLRWYTAMVLWKLAVLYEYGRRRAAGANGDTYYADPVHVRSFLDAAHTAAGLTRARAV
ncbi:MAG: phosphotransferase family protein [Pseudonocardiales bacterium]|nr:phosphotransferase family protein [Pseudonocardiales bacterium]